MTLSCSSLDRFPASSSRLDVLQIKDVSINNEYSSETIDFDVPKNALSFMVSVIGSPRCQTYLVSKLVDPDGNVFLDGEADIDLNTLNRGPNRSTVGIVSGVGSLLVPNNPKLKVIGGKWEMKVSGCRGSSVDVSITFKIGKKPSKGTLNLNVFLSGVRDWKKSNVESNSEFQQMMDIAQDIFTQAKIKLNISSLNDIHTKHNLSFSEMSALASSTESKDGINIFIIEGTKDLDEAKGISLGVPGTVEINNSASAGIFIFAGKNKIEENATDLGIFLAHEIGHYLGLYHISDAENGEDLLTDTETYHDRNLMKASVDTSTIPSLSNQQKEVLLLSPYVQN